MTLTASPAPAETKTKYATITGPIVMIGFGSIGRGTLPLIEWHFDFDPKRLVVVDPDESVREKVEAKGNPAVHAFYYPWSATRSLPTSDKSVK